jgi:hypothetical protein
MAKLPSVDLGMWILPLATGLGAWGGFPQPPAVFKKLSNNEMFQNLMFFVLLWQGGSGQDVQISAIVTVLFYVVTKLLSTTNM